MKIVKASEITPGKVPQHVLSLLIQFYISLSSKFIGDEKTFYGWMKRTKKGCACIL